MTDREPPKTIQPSPGEMRIVPASPVPPEPSAPPAPPDPPAFPKSIPWKKIGDWLAAAPKSIPLKKIGDWLAAVRTVTVNGLVLVSLVTMIYFAVGELSRKVVVIDPIRLPGALQARGYSEDVAADRLWDELRRIDEITPTAKDRVALKPASQKLDFEPPGTGIALQEVVQMLRRLLGLSETRIAGEITCLKKDCTPEGLILTLRVIHEGGMTVISVPPPTGDQTNEAELDRYFEVAALELLHELDPYVAAFYLYQIGKVEEAEGAARKLVARSHKQRKWALNLLGIIAADAGEYDEAIVWYERAIAAYKEDQGAIRWYQMAVATDEQDKLAVITYTNWGNALRAKGDKGEQNEAIEKFALAIALDPKSAATYISWGNALGEKKDKTGLVEAIKKFTLATEADPENALAYVNWGIALGKTDNLVGAIEKFTLATEVDPEYADAYVGWGNALRAQKNLDEAIEKFTLAAEIDPKHADKIFAIASRLSRDGEHRKAAHAFRRYLDSAPNARNAEWVRGKIERLDAKSAKAASD